jgi:hypothetical protein
MPPPRKTKVKSVLFYKGPALFKYHLDSPLHLPYLEEVKQFYFDILSEDFIELTSISSPLGIWDTTQDNSKKQTISLASISE